MKISIPKSGINSYTNGWLKYMAKWSGLDREDVELVSICDPDEFGLLLQPKTNKYRILGGAESFYENLYKPFVDAIVVGEGFQFFKDYKTSQNIESVLSESYIYTGTEGQITASDYVDWDFCPFIRVGKKKVMILGGRGCHNKCKFCYTSWTTKHQIPPAFNLNKPGYMVNVISNDNVGAVNQKTSVKSITVKDYLKMSEKEARNTRVYRFGIEALSENMRKKIGKPIKDKEIKAVFNISKKIGHELMFFIIAGLEPQEKFLGFLDNLGYDPSLKPKVIIKGTYFNPCLHTPMKGYDVRGLYQWDKQWIYGKLKSYSPRLKLNLRADMGYSLWRAMFHRTRNKEETLFLWKLRNKQKDELLNTIEKNNLTHLYNTPQDSIIKFGWR